MFGALNGRIDDRSVEFCATEGEEDGVACGECGVVSSDWRRTHVDDCLVVLNGLISGRLDFGMIWMMFGWLLWSIGEGGE